MVYIHLHEWLSLMEKIVGKYTFLPMHLSWVTVSVPFVEAKKKKRAGLETTGDPWHKFQR